MATLSRSRLLSWGPALLALVLALAAGWRATYGADVGDGAHVVALAVRLAQGDQPFVDEMNAQALGSWPAVPFTWLWLQLVGLDGIVLASRLFYVALATGCGVLAWWALAPHVGRAVAAGAVSFAALPTAYNLQLVSYNTTPALMLMVGTAAGTAASMRRSLGWGLVAGAATTLAAVSHPITAAAAAVLMLCLIAVVGGWARLAVVAGAIGTGTCIAVLAGVVWGIDAIERTLAFTQAYQAERLPTDERLAQAWHWYAAEAQGPLLLAAVTLGLLAAVTPLRAARVVALVAAVAATTLHAVGRGVAGARLWTWSWTSPVLALALGIVLLVPALVSGLRHQGAPLRLLALGVPATGVGLPVVAAFTSSAPAWGAVAAVLPPGLLAVGVGVLRASREHGRWATLAAAGALVLSVGLVHTATNYREAPFGELDARVEEGAFAGLLTTEGRRESIADSTRAIQSCMADGDGLLNFSYPAAHLMVEADFATPIVWLGPFGESNTTVADWLVANDREPDCIAGARSLWPGFGKSVYFRESDPFLRWVGLRYAPVPGSDAVVVLRRLPSGPQQHPSCMGSPPRLGPCPN